MVVETVKRFLWASRGVHGSKIVGRSDVRAQAHNSRHYDARSLEMSNQNQWSDHGGARSIAFAAGEIELLMSGKRYGVMPANVRRYARSRSTFGSAFGWLLKVR